MAREFNMELINYSYSNGNTATAAHIPRTPPPSPPPQEINKYCRLPPLNLQDIPEFLLCKTYFKVQKTILRIAGVPSEYFTIPRFIRRIKRKRGIFNDF